MPDARRLSLGAAITAGSIAFTAVPATASVPETPRHLNPIGVVSPTGAVTAGNLAISASIPSVFTASRVAPTSTPSMTYQVKSGDTVWAISQRTGVSIATIISANNLNSNGLIRVGQVLQIPSPAGSTTSTPAPKPSTPSQPSTPATGSQTITIKSGDTLGALAKKYGTTVKAIQDANGLKNTLIYAGRTLVIPGSGSTSAPKPSTPSQPSTPAPKPSTPSQPSTPATGSQTITIKSGDTLGALAKKYGTTVKAIQDANGMSTTVIYAGRSLIIPGSGSTSTPKPSTPSQPSTPAPKPSTPAPAPAETVTITIKSGDTLSGIAKRHNTTVQAIQQANNMTTTVIYVGRTLIIPPPGTVTTDVPQRVGNTFLHYTYPDHVVAAANVNLDALITAGVPSRAEMQMLVRETAVEMGVDPALAMAIAMKESSFNHASVSPANAIGTMQVIPSSGAWASDLVGRQLNLLHPKDNVVAGVAIIRQLLRSADDLDTAIASYYQGFGSVTRNGMFSDTKQYVSGVKSLMSQFQ